MRLAHGNRIDKRNAWATRAVAWVNLIPPGAADAAHFRLSVPEDCGDEIHLEARLNYRKFSVENTTKSSCAVSELGASNSETSKAKKTIHRNFIDRSNKSNTNKKTPHRALG